MLTSNELRAGTPQNHQLVAAGHVHVQCLIRPSGVGAFNPPKFVHRHVDLQFGERFPSMDMFVDERVCGVCG